MIGEIGMRTVTMALRSERHAGNVWQWSFGPLIATFIASALMSSTGHAQTNVLETRAKEFARAISTGRPEDLTRFVHQRFGGNLRNIPIPAHMGMLMSYWDQSRGLTFQQLVNPTDGQALAIFNNELTDGPIGIFLAIEREAPHRIVALWPLNRLRKPMPDEARPTPSGKLSDRQIARELRVFTERLARADVLSGAVVLARDGVPIFEAAYGESNKETHTANRLDTRFNVASMGKMFTAIAVAQLVQGGQLSYEDPLSKFMPDFPEEDSARKIRIKHLLSHTAGLPMGNARPPNSSPQAVDDFLQAISEPPRLQFEPGTGYQYSNMGYLLLGKVIEKVSGQSYYEYVGTRILEPAGMHDTVFEVLDRAPRDFAIGYAKKFDVEGRVHFESNAGAHRGRAGPHGGAYSTIADLLAFERALRDGKLLPPQVVRLLMTAKPELGATEYGYGFDINEALGIAGHGGGFHGISNNIDFFTQSGWTAIVLSNYTVTGFEACAPIVVKMRELVAASGPTRDESREN
jgi:CubicO group peptidase (beta-lactamase class C family)